jgi:hypothetical protein
MSDPLTGSRAQRLAAQLKAMWGNPATGEGLRLDATKPNAPGGANAPAAEPPSGSKPRG